MAVRIPTIAPSEITPPEMYFNRRKLIAGALASGASALVRAADSAPPAGRKLQYKSNPQYSVTEKPNKYEEITNYNNFYEFGADKDDPAHYAHTLKTEPWSATVEGEAE